MVNIISINSKLFSFRFLTSTEDLPEGPKLLYNSPPPLASLPSTSSLTSLSSSSPGPSEQPQASGTTPAFSLAGQQHGGGLSAVYAMATHGGRVFVVRHGCRYVEIYEDDGDGVADQQDRERLVLRGRLPVPDLGSTAYGIAVAVPPDLKTIVTPGMLLTNIICIDVFSCKFTPYCFVAYLNIHNFFKRYISNAYLIGKMFLTVFGTQNIYFNLFNMPIYPQFSRFLTVYLCFSVVVFCKQFEQVN